MGGGELDEGDEQGERTRLADGAEDVEAVLRAGFGGGDGGVADGDDEEEGVGEEEGAFEVLGVGGVEAVVEGAVLVVRKREGGWAALGLRVTG